MLTSLQLPHWLMIAGALLLIIGVIGALLQPKSADEADTTPDKSIQTPKAQMPPLPKLLESRRKTTTESEVKGPPPA